MDEKEKVGDHMTSAAAFVEGGIQDACDDSCSICLEAFCDSDPSTVTGCKHEFHLQCILEWCQRSSQCPMCWQQLSLKDPTSQELFEGVERERNIRLAPARNSTIFHHPTLGDFELQHLPVGADDAELEERIIQHLAAAAAMGRAHHLARREGHRVRISGQGRPQFLLFSTPTDGQSAGPVSSLTNQREGTSEQAFEISATTPLPLISVDGEESAQPVPQVPTQASQALLQGPGPSINVANRPLLNRGSASPSSPIRQERPGPSEFQSFSDSLKAKLNAVSTRYKESISKSTRGWKEKFFSRNTTVSDIGTEVRREVNVGIATVSRMMERLDTRDTNNRASASSVPQNADDTSSQGHLNANDGENIDGHSLSSENSTSASCTATAGQS